jgi:hypothetical protein
VVVVGSRAALGLGWLGRHSLVVSNNNTCQTCQAVPARLVAGTMVCRPLGRPGWCREGLHIHALLIRHTAALSLTVQTHDQVGVFLGFLQGSQFAHWRLSNAPERCAR